MFSKLSVKKLERIWEGWGIKREHVEAITGCKRDRLALDLPGATSQVCFYNQPTPQYYLLIWVRKPQELHSGALSMEFCLGGDLDSNDDSVADTKEEIPHRIVMWIVESSALHLGGVRRLLILDCWDWWKRINSCKKRSYLAVFLWMPRDRWPPFKSSAERPSVSANPVSAMFILSCLVGKQTGVKLCTVFRAYMVCHLHNKNKEKSKLPNQLYLNILIVIESNVVR